MPAINILEPDLRGNEARYLQECISDGWISSGGRFVQKFEQMMLRGIENREGVACSNGTVALHLALLALGVGHGDEVIVPDITFGASVNAVFHAGATPVFVDIDPESWNISLQSMRKAITPKTKAIMPVALFGNPSGIKELVTWGKKNGIFVLLDAAEAVGAKICGEDIGAFGDAVTYSFFGNKTITTGEGGGIIFAEKSAADSARILRDHGMTVGRRYHHEVVGYNYRITNIQAAVGVAQYERLSEIIAKRDEVFSRYKQNLGNRSFLSQRIDEDVKSSNWIFAVRLPQNKLAAVCESLNKQSIEFRRCFEPMCRQPAFRSGRATLPLSNAANLYESLILLPTHSNMTPSLIDQVCDSLSMAVG